MIAESFSGRIKRDADACGHLAELYLCSDFASATTGRALGVDGGLVPTIIP